MNPYVEQFCRHTADLIDTEQVQSMAQWKHHGDVSTLDHSLFVSYVSYRIAAFFRWDTHAVARAGLLHDMYLYDGREKPKREQCMVHPRIAAENAQQITDLTDKERNIILSHMWPMGGPMPKYKEAWLVDIVDTACATLELTHLYHPAKIRTKLTTDVSMA